MSSENAGEWRIDCAEAIARWQDSYDPDELLRHVVGKWLDRVERDPYRANRDPAGGEFFWAVIPRSGRDGAVLVVTYRIEPLSKTVRVYLIESVPLPL